MLKFYWNGIKHTGVMYSGSWGLNSSGDVWLTLKESDRYNRWAKIPDFDYKGARQQNDSSGYDDYWEPTSIIFAAGGELFDQALAACQAQKEKLAERLFNRATKAIEKGDMNKARNLVYYIVEKFHDIPLRKLFSQLPPGGDCYRFVFIHYIDGEGIVPATGNEETVFKRASVMTYPQDPAYFDKIVIELYV